MPTIKLTDSTNAAFDVELGDKAPVAKYFKNLQQLGLPNLSFAALSNKPLDQVVTTEVSSGIEFEHPVDIGLDQVEMTIKAGLSGAIALHTPDDSPLFDPDPFGSPINIEADERYLSAAIKAELAGSLSSTIHDLKFGFDAGGAITLANYKRFTKPAASPFPNFLDGIGETLKEFSIPGDLTDVQQMTDGTISTVAGQGSLKFSGKTTLFSTSNPLAVVPSVTVPNFPDPIGGVNISAGGEIKIGASFELSGEYQVRVQKTAADTFLLGYYKKRGTDFKLSMSGSFGISATTGKDTDLIESLLTTISPDPKPDDSSKEALIKAGLSEAQVGAMAKAIEASIQRTLELAIGVELDSLHSTQEAFLFSVRMDQLDNAGKKAVHEALDGDLSALLNRGANPLPGIRVEKDILTEIEKSKHTIKVNLLGILNWGSVKTLALKHTVLTDPQTGNVTITDEATASTYNLLINNFTSDFLKLRRALVESFLISAAYQASGLGVSPDTLTMSHSYFELHSKTNAETMRDNLDAVVALELIDAQTKDEVLSKGNNFGFSTFDISTSYNNAQLLSLFMDGDKPRSVAYYLTCARNALGMLVQADEANESHRRLLLDNNFWVRLSKNPAALSIPSHIPTTLFPELSGLNPDKINQVRQDFVVITWWAEAMNGMAEKLAEMRVFLSINPPQGNDFNSLRRELAKSLKSVASNTKAEFDDPFGILAVNLAAGRQGEAAVKIRSQLANLDAKRP
jgi:hypothetical protein